MNNITSYLSIALLGTCSVLYPFWIRDGYLDEWYPRIGAFISIYGGLAANIVYIYTNRKK